MALLAVSISEPVSLVNAASISTAEPHYPFPLVE